MKQGDIVVIPGINCPPMSVAFIDGNGLIGCVWFSANLELQTADIIADLLMVVQPKPE